MRSFNVICQRKGRSNSQFLCGFDEVGARQVASDESSIMKKGDKITLWSIDVKTKTESEVACVC